MPTGARQAHPSIPGWLTPVLAALGMVFLAAHFLHPSADFPNRTPWVDTAKATSEGWVARAATGYFVDGHWYLPGAFNPAVASPVWPAVLGVWFKATGVSMASARILTLLFYVGSLCFVCLLVRRRSPGPAWAAVLLLMAVNPYCYVFNRVALPEPVLIFWFFFSLWLADRTPLEATGRHLLLGLTVALLFLTQTGGITQAGSIFLVPAVLYHLWAANGLLPAKRLLRPAVTILSTAAVVCGGWYVLVVRPHYLADYNVLSAMHQSRTSFEATSHAVWRVLVGSFTTTPVLFPAALLTLALAAFSLRRLWCNPLFGSAALALFGSMASIGYYARGAEAHQYLLLALPVTVLSVLGLFEVLDRTQFWGSLAALALSLTAIAAAQRTIFYAMRPGYAMHNASLDIAAHIHADHSVPAMLLSNSGDNITLFTGIAAIPWEFTTIGLLPLVDRYHPGWYAAWIPEEDAVQAQLGARYRLTEVARYRLFDLPLKEWMVLYRLDPIEASTRK